MRRSSKCLPLLTAMALLTSFGGAVCAQSQAPPEKENKTATFTSETRLVVLHASVVDQKGKLVPRLPETAFKVFENGTPQQIKLFRQEDVPISLGIIIDNSGSMRDKRAKVEAAALDLVKASNPQDEVFIVNFNDEAYLDQEFTSDQKKMEEKLARIDSRGGTAMRDAISMSMDYLKESGKRDKKVLLVITDGNDNTSQGTLERLISKLENSENGVLVYAIGLLNEEERREAKKAKRALDTITTSSGGVAYYPKELAEVDRIALQVAAEIRNQYTIAYQPSNEALDGSFRRITVTVNGPGHPTVRTRSGYYAKPDLPKTTTATTSVSGK